MRRVVAPAGLEPAARGLGFRLAVFSCAESRPYEFAGVRARPSVIAGVGATVAARNEAVSQGESGVADDQTHCRERQEKDPDCSFW